MRREQPPTKKEVSARPVEQDDGRILTPEEAEEERRKRLEEDWREPNP